MVEGQQILSLELTKLALAKGEDQGLHASWYDSANGQSKYKLSFWSVAWGDGNCIQRVPYMSGYGGNTVALLPNGITAFRFADEDDYNPFPLINAAARLAPMCK